MVEYNQVKQQASQDPTVMKSPQRTASIRASSMPRLAVEPQVTQSDQLQHTFNFQCVLVDACLFVLFVRSPACQPTVS